MSEIHTFKDLNHKKKSQLIGISRTLETRDVVARADELCLDVQLQNLEKSVKNYHELEA